MDDAATSLFGDGLGATLVTTVAARARGTALYRVPEWRDEQAEEVLRELEKRARDAGVDITPYCLTNRSDVVGTIRRSQAIDALTRDFARRHPGGAQVLTIGLGLCNRAARLAELDVRWFGIDRAPVIALRREVVSSDATTLISGESTKGDVLEPLDPTRPTLAIAEGLLMYLSEAEVAQILSDLRERFTTVEFVADIFDTATMGGKPTREAKITGPTGVVYTHATDGAAGLAACSPGWEAVADINVASRISRPMAAFTAFFRATHKGRLPYEIAHIRAR